MKNIENLIEKSLSEIKLLHGKLFHSEADNNNFFGRINKSWPSLELLKIYEEKIEELQFEYFENEVLFENVANWMKLWQEYLLFNKQTSNPNRFKNRKFNGAEEEKSRKQYKLQFKKLEEAIKLNCDDYSARNSGKVFLINGYEYNVFFDKNRESLKQTDKKENSVIIPLKLQKLNISINPSMRTQIANNFQDREKLTNLNIRHIKQF